MTLDTSLKSEPRRPVLDRGIAMRLAAEEYSRVAEAAGQLSDQDWARPTANAGWTVRDMLGHTLGMARMAASLFEQRSQTREASRRGGVWIDALTAIQVERTAQLSTDELVAELARTGARAAAARRRTPGLIRRRAMPFRQQIDPDGPPEEWTIGFLVDVILTRDPWMHRADLAVATGRPMTLTAGHDGALVADVVREWAGRHRRPYRLVLTGPAGGERSVGSGGEELELDAVRFCRLLSGRDDGHPADPSSLLAVPVPF